MSYPIDRTLKHASKNAFKAEVIPIDGNYFSINENNDITLASVQNLLEEVITNLNEQTFITGDYLYCVRSSRSGFLLCNGLAISRTEYVDLFALIGTSFGIGDGSTTFNLPDFRGRVAGMIGQGSGLTNRSLGDKVGAETHTLTVNEMPSHSHNVRPGIPSSISYGASTQILNNFQWNGSNSSVLQPFLSSAGVNSATLVASGGNQSHNNMQPTLFGGNWFIKY